MGGAGACLDKQVSKCVRRREVLSGTVEGPCSSGQGCRSASHVGSLSEGH